MERKVIVHANGLSLVPIAAARTAARIAPPKGDRALNRLQVDPPSAAGAVVDEQPRFAGDHRVPHRVMPFDVADLGHALAVGRVVVAPEGQGVDVEIVAVPVHAELADALDEQVGQPAPRGGVAELEQPAAGPAEDELGMFSGDLAAGRHAFRLEPDDEFQPQAVTLVAHRLQPAGKLLGLAKPVAHAVGKIAREPSGIEPKEVAAGLGGDAGGVDLPSLGGPGGMAVVAVVPLQKTGTVSGRDCPGACSERAPGGESGCGRQRRSPCQAMSKIRGLRIASPGCSRRWVRSMPARRRVGPAASRW